MYSLVISQNAENDIIEISEVAEQTAIDLAALIEAIKADQWLLRKLTEDYFENYNDPSFNVDTWQSALRVHGISLWRIKPTEDRNLSGYRIIYTYDGRAGNDIYYVLAVIPRSFDYDANSEISRRIFSDYEKIGLPIISTR
jgi:mRNA-degrading endonuclease RelE of RelBE toxin-antitoxin system